MKLKIKPEELKLALTSPHYHPSRVIVIVEAPTRDTWTCAYMLPLEAIALIEKVAAMGEQVRKGPPARWGSMLGEIVANGQTAVVKYWGTEDRYTILLEGFDSSHLHKLRGTVAPS